MAVVSVASCRMMVKDKEEEGTSQLSDTGISIGSGVIGFGCFL